MDPVSSPLSTNNSEFSERVENHAISVGPDLNCVFDSTFQTQEVECICKNNCDRTFRGHIEIVGRRGNNQISLINPELGSNFELGPYEKRSIGFKVESRTYGESQEYFIIKFDKFRIKRSISLIVCETNDQAEVIKQGLVDSSVNMPRYQVNRSRHYANQVNISILKIIF